MNPEHKLLRERLLRQAEEVKELVQDGKISTKSNARFRAEQNNRNARGQQDKNSPQPIFLNPKDIEDGVKYDVEKVYFTTLGGEYRRLTQADIQAFAENIKMLDSRYEKGITAKKVINLSLPIDVQRCNKEILAVTPHKMTGSIVHFITSASRKYKEREHFVNVEFLKYRSFSLSPNAPIQANIKRDISLGGLKFECDCGRHTYWFRYMATVGGYGLGRKENGFPKERNPNLSGVACKHVLRVMQYVQTPLFQSYLANNLRKERSQQIGKPITQSKAQMLKSIEEQKKHASTAKNRNVKINPKARDRELNARMKQHAKKLQDQEAKKVAKQNNISEEKARKRIKADARIQLQGLFSNGLVDEKTYKTILEGLK